MGCLSVLFAIALIVTFAAVVIAMIPVGLTIVLVMIGIMVVFAIIGWIIILIEKIRCKSGHHKFKNYQYINGVKYGYCENCNNYYQYNDYDHKWIYVDKATFEEMRRQEMYKDITGGSDE